MPSRLITMRSIAIQLRLKGLYHLMVGDEEQATRHLYRSIDCFSLTNSMQAKYAIQIAASLAYLAEIEQSERPFPSSCHPLRRGPTFGGRSSCWFRPMWSLILILGSPIIGRRFGPSSPLFWTGLRRFLSSVRFLEGRIARILPILNCLSAWRSREGCSLSGSKRRNDETIWRILEIRGWFVIY